MNTVNDFETEHKECLKEIEKILNGNESPYDKVFWVGTKIEAHLSNPKYETEQAERRFTWIMISAFYEQ